VDKDDHMMEGMYRLLLDDPRYFDIGEFKRQGPIEDLVIGPPQLTLGDIDFNEITKRKR
jgi:hypothetical protein